MECRAYFIIRPEEVAAVHRKMVGISAVDRNFVYKIAKLDDDRYLLVIYAGNRDEAHKKALWVRSKVFNGDRMYWVKERR